MFRLNKKNNKETDEILPEDMTSTWKNGYNEGRIQGYQEAISDMIDLFLNSDLAKNNHINSISAELSKTKRRKEDKIKSEHYTNIYWFKKGENNE